MSRLAGNRFVFEVMVRPAERDFSLESRRTSQVLSDTARPGWGRATWTRYQKKRPQFQKHGKDSDKRVDARDMGRE